MSGTIDEGRAFLPLRIAVLTVSDTRDLDTDRSGQVLVERLEHAGHRLVERVVVTDDRERIAARVRAWCVSEDVDVVLTTGGTGVTARDVTPEAVRDVIHKEVPGFGELFRSVSVASIGTSTVQSRAMAGIAGRTYVFALPGSTGACKDAWDQILVYQLDVRHRPCNFAELLPRLAGAEAIRASPRQAMEVAWARWGEAVQRRDAETLATIMDDACQCVLEDRDPLQGPEVIVDAVLELLGGDGWSYRPQEETRSEAAHGVAWSTGWLLSTGGVQRVCSCAWAIDGAAARLLQMHVGRPQS